jgi:hypothetical protein
MARSRALLRFLERTTDTIIGLATPEGSFGSRFERAASDLRLRRSESEVAILSELSPDIDRKCGSNFGQRTSIAAIEEGPETHSLSKDLSTYVLIQ